MQVITCKNTTSNPLSSFSTVSATHSRQIKFLSGVLPLQFNCKLPRTRVSTFVDCSGFADGRTQKWKIIRGQELGQLRHSSDTRREIGAVNGSKGESLSPGDEKPYELLPGGRRAYLDEQDIVTFLDPPKELIPLDPASYNPAVYLWKKIGDIPEERRHRLIYLLKPRLISRVWEIAGTRYEDSKLAKKSASSLISTEDSEVPVEVWDCRTSGGPFPISWINFFNKAVFHCKDGKTYGRIAFGGSVLAGVSNSFCPLYFTVTQLNEIMSTEQPCDLAYEFGDGLLDLHDYPLGFPKPVKHLWPFNDHVVVYVRHVGPGVMVGQAWQEGKVLEQVPKKLCGEILMVKR